MREVVVTGGGTGIGLATAAAFVAGGDRVHIVGRRAAVLQATAERIGAVAVAGDLSTPAGAASVAASLPRTVDVLINNAGGNSDFDRSSTNTDPLVSTADSWSANWTSNVLPAVLITTALTERFSDDARLVNVGSIAAPQGSGSYGAAKAALASWTVGLAHDLGPRRITANLVAPGLVEDTEFFRGRLTEERRARLIGATATRRAGRPDDIAAVITFLASPGARHLTGQVIHVNGGAHSGG